MQDLHNAAVQIGDHVVIDWPLTRSDHRRGHIQEVRLEGGQRLHAFFRLDGVAVLFPMARLRRA